MLKSVGKQSGKSVQPVQKKKRKATVGRTCKKKEGFKSGIKEWGVRDDENGESMDDGTDGRTVPLIRLGESELWRD